jgi:hypothetical protein
VDFFWHFPRRLELGGFVGDDRNLHCRVFGRASEWPAMNVRGPA